MSTAILYTIGALFLAILVASFKTKGCTGNCNQGRRPCDCKRAKQ